MNPSIMETDEALIAVSPICKSTPGDNDNDSAMDTPPGLFGHPSIIVRRPVLQHSCEDDASHHGEVSYVARAPSGRPFLGTRQQSMPERANNGNVVRAPSGRPFLGTRQQSMPEISNSRDDSFQGINSPSSSSFLNNGSSSPQWTNQQQRHIRNERLFASPEGGDDAPRQGTSPSPSTSANNQQDKQETEEERAQREEEESIALAQMLMAEEAVASHRMSADFLRMNSGQFSAEDFAALQNALQEEEDVEYDEEVEEEGDDDEMSYEALLLLGERIGDVKTDRWTMIAHKEIEKLETFQYDPDNIFGKSDNKTDGSKKKDIDDSEIKCLVCQFPYEKGDSLRRLPCGHCFHMDCVDQWLKTKDVCAYCRQSICPDKEGKK